MEVLYIALIAILVICIVLACCVFCCMYCRCGESAYATYYEDSGPTKVTSSSSARELSKSEYYSNSTPVLQSSTRFQSSESTTNGQQSTPLLSSYSPKSDAEIIKTTYYPTPNAQSSATSYSSSRNFYRPEPVRNETGYSETTVSYSSERTPPYRVVTRTSHSGQQPSQSYTEVFQKTQSPQSSLKRSSSQTSLYENN